MSQMNSLPNHIEPVENYGSAEGSTAQIGPEIEEQDRDFQTISGARILLARKMADLLVLPAGVISANERAFIGDILLLLLDKVEYELRTDIAVRLAPVPDVPSIVIRALLLDKPEVAEPILTAKNTVLPELLVECARNGETAHRLMIARRYGLTTELAEEVIQHNEPEVAKLVLRREECRLSQHSIELLVSRSTVDETMQMLLLRRNELEPAHGFMMFWWVTPEARQKILSRFALDRSIVQTTIKDLYPIMNDAKMPDGLVKEILTLNDRRHRPRGFNGEIVSMDIVHQTLCLSRANVSDNTIEAVSLIAGVSRELVARILRDPGGEAFAVLCKSLGVPRKDFFECLLSPSENKVDINAPEQLSEEKAEHLLGVFDTMARDFARAVLKYWDWTGNPRIARITSLLAENSPLGN